MPSDLRICHWKRLAIFTFGPVRHMSVRAEARTAETTDRHGQRPHAPLSTVTWAQALDHYPTRQDGKALVRARFGLRPAPTPDRRVHRYTAGHQRYTLEAPVDAGHHLLPCCLCPPPMTGSPQHRTAVRPREAVVLRPSCCTLSADRCGAADGGCAPVGPQLPRRPT